MEGAEGGAGECGVRGSQRFDERFPGEGAVLVRHAVLALECASEELQTVVPPDLVFVRRSEHPRQVGHNAVGQFRKGEEFVGGGILFSSGSRIVGQERPIRFYRFAPLLYRDSQSRGNIQDRVVRS